MSRTVIVKDAEPVLPWLSVAEQVTEVVPIAKVEPDGGEQEAERAPSTRSTAEAVNVAGAPPGPVASKVMLAGTVTTGAVVSRTVTVNDAVPVLPWASVALHVTVVIPRGNRDPEDGAQEGESAPSNRSEAVDENVTTAPPGPVASTVMGEGTDKEGGVVSRTVTWNDPVAVLPARSVAEQLTVEVPRGKVDPEAGEQAGVSEPSIASVAVAVYVTTAPLGPVASAEMSEGSESTGACVSTTIVTEADAVLPALSVALAVIV